jgi:hypothetical protein
MKRGRLVVLGLIGIVLSFGLSGCIITSASPDPNQEIEMKPGDEVMFKVEGPAEIETESYIFTDYVWTINDEYIEATGGGGKQLDFVLDPQKFHIANRIQVECQLTRIGLQYHCDQQLGVCGWQLVGVLVDKRVWNIRIVQDGPIWQGDWIIKDNTDIQTLKSFIAITGNLTISNSNLSNLTSLENLTSVGGDLSIWGNDTLTSLTGLENLTSVDGDLSITSNDALTALKMTGLKKVGVDFTISDNSLLCRSLAEELMNQVLAGGGIGGNKNIEGNKNCTAP